MTNLGYWSEHKAEMTATIKWNSENILGSSDEMGLYPGIEAVPEFKNVPWKMHLIYFHVLPHFLWILFL
jgi:hypothetical protein